MASFHAERRPETSSDPEGKEGVLETKGSTEYTIKASSGFDDSFFGINSTLLDGLMNFNDVAALLEVSDVVNQPCDAKSLPARKPKPLPRFSINDFTRSAAAGVIVTDIFRLQTKRFYFYNRQWLL